MNAYIKNIEMPESCICCDLSHEDGWCPIKRAFIDRYSYETCPVIRIPARHGKLIEAEALLDKCYLHYENYMLGKIDGKTALLNIEKEIKSAPTIIPAEAEEE